MRIGLTSAARRAPSQSNLQTVAKQSLELPKNLDKVDVGSAHAISLGSGNSYGHGVVGRFLKWTGRELPTTLAPMTEEEKQQILDKIEPGDILLTYHSQRPNLGHFEHLTTGADYTHCAIYEGYGRIIETQGDAVKRSSLIDRLEGPVKVAVVRPPYKNFRDRGLVIRAAKDLIGRPYDYQFDNHDHSKLYCSEFIEVALKAVDPELEVPDVHFLGREVTAPDAFAQMKGASLIHDGHSNYWANQLYQWPLYLGAAVGAGLGASVGAGVGSTVVGALGSVVGAVAGFEASVATQKWFQGH